MVRRLTFFHSSARERNFAARAPFSFACSEFFRAAAVTALVITVWQVVFPSEIFNSAGVRLYFVASMGVWTAGFKLLSLRVWRRGIATYQP